MRVGAVSYCGGPRLDDERVVVQYQTEIPRRPIQRQFNIRVARCRGCGRAVQGRHELQTSDATGAAAQSIITSDLRTLAQCSQAALIWPAIALRLPEPLLTPP